MAIEGA